MWRLSDYITSVSQEFDIDMECLLITDSSRQASLYFTQLWVANEYDDTFLRQHSKFDAMINHQFKLYDQLGRVMNAESTR